MQYVYMGRMDASILDPGPSRQQNVKNIIRNSHQFGQMDLFTECKDVLMKPFTSENALKITMVAKEFKMKANYNRVFISLSMS